MVVADEFEPAYVSQFPESSISPLTTNWCAWPKRRGNTGAEADPEGGDGSSARGGWGPPHHVPTTNSPPTLVRCPPTFGPPPTLARSWKKNGPQPTKRCGAT